MIKGTDNYEGIESEPVSFTIEPKSTGTDSQLKVPDITADTNLDNLTLKDGDKVLIQGKDYDVTKVQAGNKVTVTITFKGNYTGTLTKSYTVEDKKKPDTGKKPSASTDSKGSKGSSAETGDTSAAGLWTALMAFAAGTFTLLKRRKRREEPEK